MIKDFQESFLEKSLIQSTDEILAVKDGRNLKSSRIVEKGFRYVVAGFFF